MAGAYNGKPTGGAFDGAPHAKREAHTGDASIRAVITGQRAGGSPVKREPYVPRDELKSIPWRSYVDRAPENDDAPEASVIRPGRDTIRLLPSSGPIPRPQGVDDEQPHPDTSAMRRRLEDRKRYRELCEREKVRQRLRVDARLDRAAETLLPPVTFDGPPIPFDDRTPDEKAEAVASVLGLH